MLLPLRLVKRVSEVVDGSFCVIDHHIWILFVHAILDNIITIDYWQCFIDSSYMWSQSYKEITSLFNKEKLKGKT
jgi:hypothetical protein